MCVSNEASSTNVSNNDLSLVTRRDAQHDMLRIYENTAQINSKIIPTSLVYRLFSLDVVLNIKVSIFN